MAILGAPYTVMAAQVCKNGFFDLFRAIYIFKEPVLPEIGQNWHDVKIDGMCTQC